MSQEKETTFVGYVNTPRTSIQFSFTEQELDDMKKMLKPNAKDPSKPARVYCEFKSGMSKAGKAYSFIEVKDLSTENGQTYAKTPTPQPVTDDLPF